MPSERLDQYVSRLGLAESREKAKRLIMAGKVRVNGQLIDKAAHACKGDEHVEVEQPPRFVSRGGEKLQGAIDSFGLNPAGCVCLDVGASTGGFTDCLLQHGATHVFAIDVGKGQLHLKLREDDRVTVHEGLNARYLQPDDIGQAVDLVTIDVSFISLQLILPAVVPLMKSGAHLLSLIKPQFEAGRDDVGKGGVVRDPAVHDAVIDRVQRFGTVEMELEWLDVAPSPIKGPAGNTEFLAYWRRA